MRKILGVSAGYHDAAVSLIDETGEILFAAHSERYSKVKNDSSLSSEIFNDVDLDGVDTVAFYENSFAKQMRQLYSGQGMEFKGLFNGLVIREHLSNANAGLVDVEYKFYNHHLSHAAAGFQTSSFRCATVVVIDAIGEWDTITIWAAEYDRYGHAKYKKLWGQKYPHSLGLFYSAMTQRVGLKPLEEEYIMMGMAAYGKPIAVDDIKKSLVLDTKRGKFKENLHAGVPAEFLTQYSNEDLAASAQSVFETMMTNIMAKARSFKWSSNLVYMGGSALNCLANRHLGRFFDHIWIMPNPGDAGSSLGAAALAYGKELNWTTPYLGYNIDSPYPVEDLLHELDTNKIVGVANGRAEFGPRALGNRSLLADPRGNEIKDKVNEIKRRQKFRPFAPVILEEYAHDYFEFPQNYVTSPYMQVVAKCKFPEKFPAIIHADGTSRVQTVSKNCGSGIRDLLERWYVNTGCPMLLNTSLNIRGEPMVNDLNDAARFQAAYGVKVCS